MYFNYKVTIPKEKGKISITTIKGIEYVNYEYDRIYKPDKKYNIRKRTTIGKVCEDEKNMMYPNPNYVKFFPNEDIEREEKKYSSCIKVGNYIVLKKYYQKQD